MSTDGAPREDRKRSQIAESDRSRISQNASLNGPSPQRGVRESMILPGMEDKSPENPKRGPKQSSVLHSMSGGENFKEGAPSSILKNDQLYNIANSKLGERLKHKKDDHVDPKKIEDELTRQIEMKMISLQKQEEIINNSNIPHKKELLNTFNTSKQKYTKKPSELKNLGPLSVKLESMKVSIEKRYEYMLYDLNQRLEAIKKYFNNMVNEVKGDAFNSIVNEKDQNLSNIKENLENILMKIKETGDDASVAEKANNDAKEKSFYEFFEFFENFKEDCFNSIVSKASTLNLDYLKKQLGAFKSSHLENLLTAPKVFTSNLLRFFEVENKQYDEKRSSEKRKFGDVLEVKSEIVESKFYRNSEFYDPELNSKSKTPMLCVINNKFMVVVTRDKFRIVQYQYASGENNVPKSKFYQHFHHDKGERLNFIDVCCSSDIHQVDIKSQSDHAISYHSICAAKKSDDIYYLLFGGNDCVVF